MNSEETNEYIRKLLLMSVSELKALKERDRIETEQLQAQIKANEQKNSTLKERYRKAENEINKTRAKTMKKIAKLEKNKNEMQKMFNSFVEEMNGVAEKFRTSCEKSKDVKKMFVEKCLDIRGSREDFMTRYTKLHGENKAAKIDLEYKKGSLAANLQVLESKMACLAKDQEEYAKKAKELESLTGKKHKDLLKEMEQKEENMKLEFSDMRAKLAECNNCIANLDDENALLTVETDKLSLELVVEEKFNQKINTELQSEEEHLEKTVLDMLGLEVNSIHRDNLELAKMLRDDLIKNEENIKEIQLLEKEKAQVENNNQEFDILKEQKLEQLKTIETDILASIEEKSRLELKVDESKSSVLNKQEIEQSLKNKIAKKEDALKKQQLKASKTARPKGKKNKEPPVTKSKASKSDLIEPTSISNGEQSDPTIFSSFSSGESDMSFSMSSTMAGK